MRHSPSDVRSMSARALRHVALTEMIGFGVIVAVIWLDELFDLPHWLFGAPISPTRLTEAAMESLGVVLLAAIVLLSTRRLIRRVVYLESYITLCAWCRRVHRDELLNGGPFQRTVSVLRLGAHHHGVLLNVITGSSA